MTVSAALGRNIDTCNGTTTVRTIPFKLLDASHVKIYPYTISTSTLGAALTLNSDYTIQNIGSDNAQYTTTGGSSPWSSLYKLIVVRSVPFSQSTAYVQNDSFPAASHETALDKLTMIAQQMQDTMSRAAVLPQFSDPALAVVLPTPVDGYGLVWSGTGGTLVNTSVSLATLQTQAAALFAIAANITTVAGISANVTTVAGDTTNINTVAGISANVTTVAGIAANVTTVAGISTDVTSVKNIAANVTTVAGIAAAVSTVSGINAAVSTVSGISANVTTVAGISANVTTVAGISANVTTVAGISANVTSVAGDLTNINNVAADLTNINNVAADLTNINNVAADLTNINNVAADLTNIDTCASNIAAINAAPAQAAAAAASAASAAASASGISMRGSCRVCATGALTVTYLNGVLGVGATLTNAGAKAAFAQDGITVSVGERVLVPSQASALQNGMYTLTVAGDGSTNWVLTRATDYDEASEVVEGTATIIEEGTVNASHIYVMTHHGAITMGTTAIDFTALTSNATSANTLTTPRAIYGNNFDGSAALTQIIASTYGGTGNGFAKLSGPTTSEKTWTGPDASCTLLTSNAAVTVAQGGTGVATLTTAYGVLCAGTTATGTVQTLAALGTSGWVLTSNGAGALPSFAALPAASATGYTGSGYVAGRYYTGLGQGSWGGNTLVVTASRQYFVPAIIGKAVTLTKIGVKVATGAGTNCRLGIYNMANGVPTSVVVDAGAVNVSTSGIKEATINVALNPGAYAFCAIFDNTPTVDYYQNTGNENILDEFWGMATWGAASPIYGAYSTQSYGALPDPYAGSLTYTFSSATMPIIYVRA